MQKEQLLSLLEQVREGKIAPQEAAEKLKLAPIEDLGYAKIDHHRALRQGAAEVIYGRPSRFSASPRP